MRKLSIIFRLLFTRKKLLLLILNNNEVEIYSNASGDVLSRIIAGYQARKHEIYEA